MEIKVIDEYVTVTEYDDGTRSIKIHDQVFKLPGRVGVYQSKQGIRFNYQVNRRRIVKTSFIPEMYVEAYESFIIQVCRFTKLYDRYFIRRWFDTKKDRLPEWIGKTVSKGHPIYVVYDPIEDKTIYIGRVSVMRREDLIYRSDQINRKLEAMRLTADDIF